MEREFTEQELVRREKAKNIREMGMDPFGHKFVRDSFASEIKDKYKDVPHDDFENMTDTATVAGRIMFIRKIFVVFIFYIFIKVIIILIIIMKIIILINIIIIHILPFFY